MQTTPEMPILEKPITGPIAWEAETLLADEGTVTLPDDCIAELMAAARLLADNPLPIEALRPEDFELPSCTALMGEIRQTLDHGIGFAIVDRLPLDQVDVEIAPKLYWLLMSMVARPVAQKWDGTMVYAVTDTGVNSAPGNGVRASKTSEGQSYHTDNAFNLPPDFVSLFCLRPAREGGESGIVSFASVYNHLLADFAETIPRFYRPFFFDRQKEHAPGDWRVSSVPIMESDGETVTVRLSQRLIPQGYAVEGVEMDDETRAAMAALAEVTERPALGRSFTFEPGQIQILNNRRIGHRRTAFTDWPEAGRKRHLVRIWMRKSGRAFYHG